MVKVRSVHNLLLLGVLVVVAVVVVQGYRQQPQCSWLDSSALRCFVRPGHHNLIVEESVAGRGPEHAKSLWVNCEDSASTIDGSERLHYLHSNLASTGYVLSDGVFMSVKNLLDLRFENCQISGITPGAFDYFPHLQNFTLHASTSLSWPILSSGSSSTIVGASPTTLSVKDAFRSLHKLQRLDLATTSLSIPADFLCLLPSSITHLNLSSTSLRDLRGISPSDPTTISHCGHQLQSLDLSSNYISLLPPATFSSLTKLEELILSFNVITTVAERALLGLSSLRSISLIGNSIKSLAPQFFKDNRHLQEIFLQNNSLSIIAPGLFNNLEHLYHLDLSHNELSSDWINGDTFRGLRSLSYLSLSHNHLTRMDSSLFRDLVNIQVLILSHNQFKTISAQSICNGVAGQQQYSLRFLALDNNKIEHVQVEAFKNCTKIEDLNLSGNKLTSVPSSLGSLVYLRYIDLGENNITNVTHASYQKLHNLNGLRLTDNKITSIDKDSFKHLTSLKIVNLAKNNISHIEVGTFDHNLNLQALRLDSNSLNDANISHLVTNLKNLLWLSLNENLLTELNYEELPSKLQWIELRGNQITRISGSIERSRITKLDLSDNYLIELGSAQLPDSLVQLSLRNNSLAKIQPYTFLLKENITLIDLSFNKLTNLDQNALRLNGVETGVGGAAAGSTLGRGNVEVLLGGNEFICDCSMQWLQDIHEEYYTDYRYPVIADEIKCNPQPYSTQGLPNYIFLCKYESRCPPSCHCCGFNCDCELTCPDSCSCYNDQVWSVNIVDCSNLQYKTIPTKIPVDLTELRLDGSILPTLESNSFFQHKYLKALYLNSSQIEFISNKSFHGLHQLTTLHLENNFIEKLDGYEFSGLNNLEELYLQQNSIFWIGNETFTKLPRLRVLWLQQNNFVNQQIWEVLNIRIGRLAELRLSGSDYSCECEYYSEFKNWLIEYQTKISDVDEIHCVDTVSSTSVTSSSSSSSSNKNIVNKSELLLVKLLNDRNPKCGSSGVANANGRTSGSGSTATATHHMHGSHHHRGGTTNSNSSSSSDTNLSVLEPSSSADDAADMNDLIIPLIIGAVGLILLLLVFVVLSTYWRDSIQIWMHANCGLRLQAEPSEEKLFDAFISYSSKDEAWVRQVLASELERHSPPYRLCLRYRDIPIPGSGTYLADTLVSAFEASRRTILVLSHHFLKGEWNRIEVKSAHAQLFKDRTNRVVILILGDLPPNIDPELRLYLKTHKKNTINCDDKRFWDKLHYCMPDVKMKVPLPLLHGNGHPHQHQQQQHHQHQQHQRSLPHTHSHSHSRSNSNNSHSSAGSCSLYNNSTGNYCSSTTATNSTTAHSYSTLQNHNTNHNSNQHTTTTLMSTNHNHHNQAHPHPHPHITATATNTTSHSPSNMIVYNGTGTGMGTTTTNTNNNTGNNRSRHVAIHI